MTLIARCTLLAVALATCSAAIGQVLQHSATVGAPDQTSAATFTGYTPRYPGELLVVIQFYDIVINEDHTSTNVPGKRIEYWFQGVDGTATLHILRTSTDEPTLNLVYPMENFQAEIVFTKPFFPQEFVRLEVLFADGALSTGRFIGVP